MPTIPGFWDPGPHHELPVEGTWQEFIESVGGEVLSRTLPKSPDFQNADFLIRDSGVVLELKEVETEFSQSSRFRSGLNALIRRITQEDPTWRPSFLGGDGPYPAWFQYELVRLFRRPIERILEKANVQIRQTKAHFGIESPTGVLLFVNDGFSAIWPKRVLGLAANLLTQKYSSVDCIVYLTINRFVEVAGSSVPNLLWAPLYSNRAQGSLSDFINDLGRKWGVFLEKKVGNFTLRYESDDGRALLNARPIILPK